MKMLIWEARETFQSQDIRRWQAGVLLGALTNPLMSTQNQKKAMKMLNLSHFLASLRGSKLQTCNICAISLKSLIWRDVSLMAPQGLAFRRCFQIFFFYYYSVLTSLSKQHKNCFLPASCLLHYSSSLGSTGTHDFSIRSPQHPDISKEARSLILGWVGKA